MSGYLDKVNSLQTEDKLKKILNADPLFTDQKLDEISNSLSEEDKKRYKNIGEEMYNSIKFEDINSQGSTAINNHEEIELENVSQLKLMLLSGLHPSYLNNEEKDMLKNMLGDRWFEKFGFLETDLNRINF